VLEYYKGKSGLSYNYYSNHDVGGCLEKKMKAFEVAQQFRLPGKVISVESYGEGIINDTYLLVIDAVAESRVILQRINAKVFPQPALVMQNMRVICEHGQSKAPIYSVSDRRDFQFPDIYLTRLDEACWIDEEGAYWRAISFIERSKTLGKLKNLRQAYEIGFALGRFHNLIHSLDQTELHDTLPGFHETPGYLADFDGLVPQDEPFADRLQIDYCLAFIDTHRHLAPVLESVKDELTQCPIHGDPKLNNILFDVSNDQAVSMIDLDTVKPGLVHYDIGDCLRSACNVRGETMSPTQPVVFNMDICDAVLRGYLSEAYFLCHRDYSYFFDAIRLIPFELGLRFFTDYLKGNQYFKVAVPEQNLHRAMIQFKLAADIEKHESQLRGMIIDLAGS